jgi:hypothetical protein
MTNQGKPVRRTAAVFLAFSLIASVLPGFAAAQDMSTRKTRAEEAVSNSRLHHREHNFLLDATISGNMDSFNKGLRRFDGGECEPQFLVYDFKKQDFLGFSRWIRHPTKKW